MGQELVLRLRLGSSLRSEWIKSLEAAGLSDFENWSLSDLSSFVSVLSAQIVVLGPSCRRWFWSDLDRASNLDAYWCSSCDRSWELSLVCLNSLRAFGFDVFEIEILSYGPYGVQSVDPSCHCAR